MNRAVLFALIAGVLVATAPACRAEDKPDGDEGRYTFTRTDDGYLRLDGRTGQVSTCTRRPAGWACQMVPDERAALEAEMNRLQGENVALKKELLAHNLPLPGVVKPEPPAAKVDDLPQDADINKMMALVEKVWRRMVEMITNLQKDTLKKS